MNKILNKNEKIKELSEFILNRDVKEFRIKIDARKYIVLKIKLTDNIDQLFCCYHYCHTDDTIEDYDKFDSAGYITNGILYGGYSIICILGSLEVSEWNHCYSSLMLEEKIHNYIENYIINNWNHFKNNERNEYYEKTYASKMAEEWIINFRYDEVPKFKYNTLFELDVKDYLLYLDKGESYISTKGYEIINIRKYGIGNSILGYESAVKIFNEQKNNPNLIHIANMKKSLEELNAKNVKIKVCKEGISVTIQIETDIIKNCYSESCMSLWNTPKPDRDLFERIYGRYADLFPEDIQEIYFRNKTIYKKGA